MTEADATSAPGSTPAPAPAPGRSAGALLRAAREKQGVHIAALAASIKVTPRKLDALEHDRWNELPDATFTRALAQTVCRALKIDAKPVLELLPPPETAALETVAGTLNAPFSERRTRDEPGWSALAIKPMVVAAGLLLVAAIAVYLLPPSLWMPGAREGVTTVAMPPAAVPTPAPAAGAIASAPVGVPVTTPADAAASAPAATPAAMPSATVTTTVPTTPLITPAPPGATGAAGAAVPTPSPTTAPSAGPAAVPSAPRIETVLGAPAAALSDPGASASGILQLRTSEASWIEVRDGAGRTLLSRTVQPGEGVGLDGALPLRVVVGNAPATQVAFRGQPVELPRRGADTVSRIELK